MGCIKETRGCGPSCGKGCSCFVVILSWFHVIVSVTYTLFCRIYLKSYYAGAHVAAMSVMHALFVIANHLFRLRKILGISLRAFSILQILLNFWYLFAALAAAVGYTTLAALSSHLEYSYLAAALFAWVSTVLMVYLLVLSCGACRSAKFESYSIDDKVSGNMNGGGKLARSSLGGARCCVTCCRVLVWLVYTLFHVLMMVLVILTAYYPCSAVEDIVNYRDLQKDNLHTVEVKGHPPLDLYMKCFGKAGIGVDTIIFENGLGIPSSLMEPFIPKYLSDKQTVCVHDRRGIGWSQGFEVDYGRNIVNKEQLASDNVHFLKALINKLHVKTPFYYVGHSYGGHHVVNMALEYPEALKGIVFLDSMKFGLDEMYNAFGEVLVNFQYLGYVRLATDLFPDQLKEAWKDVVDVDTLTPVQRNQFYSALRSGNYFASVFREYRPVKDDSAKHLLTNAINGNELNVPVLVVDADKYEDWFPEEHFPLYTNATSHKVVANATHFSLVLSEEYGNITGKYIQDFIDATTNL